MKIGQLIPGAQQRVDIVYSDGTFFGGLHCGNTLDVLVEGKWQPTRIEYRHSAGSWYLVGIEHDEDILGLSVRN
jgi:hypothetical protein